MILVDTSVWIDYLGGVRTEGTGKLSELLDQGTPVCITPQIGQELLQGTANRNDFGILSSYLATQALLVPRDDWTAAVGAASIYLKCRMRGITVRSSNDCAIAQAALDHDVALLHSDRDFDHIAQVVPLRIY